MGAVEPRGRGIVRLWDDQGARPLEAGGVEFSVWAPRATGVSVVGDWNGWASDPDRLVRDADGVWRGVVPGAAAGDHYQYAITDDSGQTVNRADPLALWSEPCGPASRVWASSHVWQDDDWIGSRSRIDPATMRMSVYEVHLGSWRRRPDGGHLGYREVATLLGDHVERLGFTHVELLPVAEHPYDPSWGYQVTGYYAPTARFGDPDDLRWLVDHLHQRGIGVLVDWVPAHFPKDDWALVRFDGLPLYEHVDPARAEHPDWGTLEFDLGRPEVRRFLLHNACYWVEEFHIDGLRVDAVASMLYLDYSRAEGEWTPNEQGGNEDLDAVTFLQEVTTTVTGSFPGALVIAEESTAWDGVSRPVSQGGLGFTHKWNLGWMHDTLDYWSTPPAERPSVHDKLTFGLTYAYAEHFVLPLSHDEVVHLKKPLLGKMPGATDEERFDHLRALYAWMWAHPGKPLLFMGAELGEEREWSQDRSLDWSLLDRPLHAGLSTLLSALNAALVDHPALHLGDADESGFRWLEVDSASECTFAFLRRNPDDTTEGAWHLATRRKVPGTSRHGERAHGAEVLVIANLSDLDRPSHRVGVPSPGEWRLVLSSAEARFGGSVEAAAVARWSAEAVRCSGQDHSIVVDLAPRSVAYLVQGEA